MTVVVRSETFRVAKGVRKGSVQLLGVLDHFVQRGLALVNQLIKLAQLSVLHLSVQACLLSLALKLRNLIIKL